MKSVINSADIDKVLRGQIRTDVEEVWAIAVNSQLGIIKEEMIFRGHVTAAVFHPREILKFAITNSAVAIAIAHSHPSGNTVPSQQDLIQTEALYHLCKVLNIPLIDHIIMSETSSKSLFVEGYFEKWGCRRSINYIKNKITHHPL